MEDLKPNLQETSPKRYQIQLRGKIVYQSNKLVDVQRYYDLLKPRERGLVIVIDLNQLKLW